MGDDITEATAWFKKWGRRVTEIGALQTMVHLGRMLEEIETRQRHLAVIRMILKHSWKDIGYSYDGLTPKEQELIYRGQFDDLVEYFGFGT